MEKKSNSCVWKVATAVALVVGIGIGVLIGFFILGSKECQCDKSHPNNKGSSAVIESCEYEDVITQPNVPDIFAPITVDEMDKAYNALVEEGYIDDQRGSIPSLDSNYIYGISVYLPNKEDALNYLDNGGPHPGRYADVHIHRGGRIPPDLQEYKVGPLDGTDPLQVVAQYADGELPWNSRPLDYIEEDYLLEFIEADMAILKPLLMESFDGAYFTEEGGLYAYPQAPSGLAPDDRDTIMMLQFYVDEIETGSSLHTLPLSFTVHNPTVNMSEWSTDHYFYLNQGPFATAQELMNAYNNNTIRKIKLPDGYRQTISETTFPRARKPTRNGSSKPGSTTYEPNGKRYTVTDHTIQWMGWQMTIFNSQFRGPTLFDIRFKGERIVYENSLQEITLVYATDDSTANTIYTDAIWGNGAFDSAMVGVDCPGHASMIPTAYWYHYEQVPVESLGICVFEEDAQDSLWRKADPESVFGAKSHKLVVRILIPNYNYDYIVDYHFLLDGRMETKVASTGFVQAAFHDPNNPHQGTNANIDAFGYRIAQYAQGAIHDHSFGFKVDLDVAGRENIVEQIHWTQGDPITAFNTQQLKDNPLSTKPPYFLYNRTRYLKYETQEKEFGTQMNLQQPSYWVFKNEQETNEWGVPRGYRIILEEYGIQTLDEYHPAMDAIGYTKNHLTVTKQRDTEKEINGLNDLNRLKDPQAPYEKMLNGENIVNEDLVAWVTLNFLHIPTAEDYPITTKISQTFTLKPHNYFDRYPALDMLHFIDTDSGSYQERSPEDKTCVPLSFNKCYFCEDAGKIKDNVHMQVTDVEK